MRRAATLAVLAFAVADLAGAGFAGAQTADAPKPRRRPLPAPAAAPPPDRARSATTTLPAPAGRLTLSGLGGLRAPEDGGAACRSACARVRYTCEVQEEACVSPWRTCVAGCGGAAAAPGTSLLPR